MLNSEFWFLRHGVTDDNEGGRLMGRLDIPLNQRGRDQAAAAAEVAAALGLRRVVASPLARARVTAEIVAARLGLPVEFDDGLMERDWGVHQGRPLAEKPAGDPEGGESTATFLARVLATIGRHAAPDTLLVSHGGVFRALAGAARAPGDFTRVPHATLLRFCRGPAGWSIETAGAATVGDEQ